MEPASSEKELYRKDNSGRAGNGKLYLVLLVAAVCFAFAAFVIAIVSLSKQTGSSASPSVVNVGLTSVDYDKDDKVWIIQGGHAGWDHYYISEKTGKLEGFVPDIIHAVCRIANKNCKIVADPWSNCWRVVEGETPRGGNGLMAGWYDACSGYRSTTERRRTFAFSDQFTVSPHEVFVTLPGNPRNFDWRNITGKTIAFFDRGTYSNPDCLAEAKGIVGAVVPTENIRRGRFPQILEWLKDETVDALFADAILVKDKTGIEEVTDHLQVCPVSGNSLMTRYDSKLNDWWNPAQAKLIASKEYHEICNDVKVKHGHQPGYDLEDFCIGL
ncbi:uncharacterized protein [Amphiura filiformis]|uniref:uncharacterized protein isoform X1 n=1 Tax=Amphiura filiformis TaxID=82378 RepID=UPI003B2265FA